MIKLINLSITILIIGTLLFSSGFVYFLNNIPVEDTNKKIRADAVVVLTGGSFRVKEGIKLLSTGIAKRLLISGVNKLTTKHELELIYPERNQLFKCCIDLDYVAQNTKENAEQTKIWLDKHELSSAIIVTSSYHMQRTILELSISMPNIELFPYPVLPNYLRLNYWWLDYKTSKLLIGEYLKYLPVYCRYQLHALFVII